MSAPYIYTKDDMDRALATKDRENAALAARISELEAARSSEQRAAEFAARWAWRGDPPHVTTSLSDTERFSVIKFHPDIQAIARRLGLLAGGKRDG